MNQMGMYYVVSRTREKDEQFTVINAMSLDEANAIFEIRHKADMEAMKEGEAFFIFEADEALKFDEYNQAVFPSGRMAIIHKICSIMKRLLLVVTIKSRFLYLLLYK